MIFYAEDDGCVQERSVMRKVLFYATLCTFQINKNMVFSSKRNRIKIIHSANDGIFINYVLFNSFIRSHYLLQIACKDALHKK